MRITSEFLAISRLICRAHARLCRTPITADFTFLSRSLLCAISLIFTPPRIAFSHYDKAQERGLLR